MSCSASCLSTKAKRSSPNTQARECCSVLQCVVVCCSELQCAMSLHKGKEELTKHTGKSVLQRVAVCCSMLQHVAACRRVGQCVAVCCSVSRLFKMVHLSLSNAQARECCSGLQRVVGCRMVLQCSCSALHCDEVCCSVLQCVACLEKDTEKLTKEEARKRFSHRWRGGGLGSRPIFKKFHESYARS